VGTYTAWLLGGKCAALSSIKVRASGAPTQLLNTADCIPGKCERAFFQEPSKQQGRRLNGPKINSAAGWHLRLMLIARMSLRRGVICIGIRIVCVPLHLNGECGIFHRDKQGRGEFPSAMLANSMSIANQLVLSERSMRQKGTPIFTQ
jgi:hypothetical protein